MDGCSDEPEDVVDYYNRGFERPENGDLDGAIADWTRAIEMGSRDAKAYARQ